MPNLILGDWSIFTPSPSTGQGAKPLGLAGWSAITQGASNWTGIDWIAASPTGDFTAIIGTVTTFGITSPVSLTDLDFSALPAQFVLGQGSGAYSGYTLSFSVNSLANKFKSGNNYGVDLLGVLSFDDGNIATQDYIDTNWVLTFTAPGATTANQSNQAWSINGSHLFVDWLIPYDAHQHEIISVNTQSITDPEGLGEFSYQWYANDLLIQGATESSLFLTQTHVGKSISVAVFYTDGMGNQETVISGLTAPVADMNDLPSGQVIIEGNAKQGSVLTANTSSLMDADGIAADMPGFFSYQWRADGLDISGQIGQTLILSDREIGKTISVLVSYMDGLGYYNPTISSETSPVIAQSIDRKGYVLTDFGGLGDIATGVISNFDGSVVVTGHTVDRYTISTIRYLPTGEIDNTFGADGYLRYESGSNGNVLSRIEAYDIVKTKSNSLIIVGERTAGGSSGSDSVILKINSNGGFDDSFANNGALVLNSGRYEGLRSAIETDQAGIIAAGRVFNGSTEDILLTKTNQFGSLALDFGNSGVSVFDTADIGERSNEYGYSVFIQPDGKFLTIGSNGDLIFARFNTDGSPDITFGSGGFIRPLANTGVRITSAPDSFMLNSGSVFVLSRSANGDFLVIKTDSAGIIDANFGSNGFVTIDLGLDDYPYAITVDSENRILVAGERSDQTIAIARLDQTGLMDQSFGESGRVLLKIGSRSGARDLEIDENGKIVVVGYSDLDYLTLRLNQDGTLDRSFGSPVISPDTISPRISIFTNKSKYLYNETAKISFALSENSADFELSDIILSGGTLDNFQGSGGLYTADFVPDPNPPSQISLFVPDGAFSDGSGNFNYDGLDDDNKALLSYASKHPEISIISGKHIIRPGEYLKINFSLSSDAADFNSTDIVGENCILTNFAGSGSSYTADVIVANAQYPTISIQVPNGRFSNSAGIFNSDGQDSDNSWRALVNLEPQNKKGYTTTDISEYFDVAESIAYFDDGSIVVSGRSSVNKVVSTTKYTAQGALDYTFATNGLSSISPWAFVRVTDVIGSPDNKIIVTGETAAPGNGASNGFAINLNPNGQLNDSFALDGMFINNSGWYETYWTGAYDQNGSLYLAGRVYNGITDDFLLSKLLANGNLDSTFGKNGHAIFDFPGPFPGSNDVGQGIFLLASGKIIVSGVVDNKFTFVRFNTDGSIDRSFGVNGISHPLNDTSQPVEIRLGGDAKTIALDDGSFLFSGRSNTGDFFIGKVDGHGKLDTSFGVAGVTVFDMGGDDHPYAIGIDNNGGIIVAGDRSGTSIVLLRTDQNGMLDPGFGDNGRVALNIGTQSGARDLAIDTYGRILLTGYSDNAYLVARLNSDGTLDKTFGLLDNTPIGPMVYHWASHMLLSGVHIGNISAHGGVADNALFDLREARFDATTGILSMQLWSTSASARASFDFRVDSPGATSASFESALPGSWSVLANTSTPSGLSVGGFDTSIAGFTGATQLGTLTLHYPPGSHFSALNFHHIAIGTQTVADLALSFAGQITGIDGSFTLPDDGDGSTALQITRSTSDTGSALTSADALATLRIAVGMNPNSDPDGAGPLQPLRVSPYQLMAADANGSGRVTAADALEVLKMALNWPGAVPHEWFFVEETRDFWNEATQQYTLTRDAASWDRTVIIDASDTPPTGVVGVLKGDVNGSWQAPAGSVDLDTIDPSYFTNLAARLNLPTDQWGV